MTAADASSFATKACQAASSPSTQSRTRRARTTFVLCAVSHVGQTRRTAEASLSLPTNPDRGTETAREGARVNGYAGKAAKKKSTSCVAGVTSART